jgi:hypothetical protein
MHGEGVLVLEDGSRIEIEFEYGKAKNQPLPIMPDPFTEI